MENTTEENQKMDVLDISLAVIFILIIILLFTQVFLRYIFNAAPAWTEEIAKYLFVWMTFLGSAAAFRDKIHIGVDFFVSLFPERIQKYFEKLDFFAILIVSAIMAVLGFMWTINVWGMLSPAVGLPVALVLYLALPIGSTFIVYYGIKELKK